MPMLRVTLQLGWGWGGGRKGGREGSVARVGGSRLTSTCLCSIAACGTTTAPRLVEVMPCTGTGTGAIAGDVAQRGGSCISAFRHGQQVVLPLAVTRHILKQWEGKVTSKEERWRQREAMTSATLLVMTLLLGAMQALGTVSMSLINNKHGNKQKASLILQ